MHDLALTKIRGVIGNGARKKDGVGIDGQLVEITVVAESAQKQQCPVGVVWIFTKMLIYERLEILSRTE